MTDNHSPQGGSPLVGLDGQPLGASARAPGETVMTPAEAMPENVVALGDSIVKEGRINEVEKKRFIMFRAMELTANQLEHDANELCGKAVLTPPELLPMQKREQMVNTAYNLREAVAWIRTMLLPQPAQPEAPKPEPETA